uniref:Uncharacterized protein n=1 Tax=Romanomermis culicivorax TaxID=13658 RepID=A0A915IUJ4_ROMCU
MGSGKADGAHKGDERKDRNVGKMKEKIETLEKEKYGKAAIELAKQLENVNAEEEEMSEEPYVEKKRQDKEKRIVREENKAKLDKVKSGKFQQPSENPNDKVKYRRALGKRGQVINKALKEGKYIVDSHVCTVAFGRLSISTVVTEERIAISFICILSFASRTNLSSDTA